MPMGGAVCNRQSSKMMFAFLFCSAPKASLVQREVGRHKAARRDCAVKFYEFALYFGDYETFCCDNPSVKIGSREPILTAPLTQGSL